MSLKRGKTAPKFVFCFDEKIKSNGTVFTKSTNKKGSILYQKDIL
jgi:hypothetical protein